MSNCCTRRAPTPLVIAKKLWNARDVLVLPKDKLLSKPTRCTDGLHGWLLVRMQVHRTWLCSWGSNRREDTVHVTQHHGFGKERAFAKYSIKGYVPKWDVNRGWNVILEVLMPYVSNGAPTWNDCLLPNSSHEDKQRSPFPGEGPITSPVQSV